MKYTVIVEKGQESGYVAYAPALKGCVSQGDTKEEALKALQDAAQACLEVMNEHGDPLSEKAQQEVTVIDSPDVVAVTV